MIRVGALCALAALVAGCADLSPMAQREIAWQALNVVDTGQTITIARQPSQLEEGNFITQSLVGRHPTERNTYAMMAGYAILHAGVSVWLDSNDPGRGPWHVASLIWGYGMLTGKGLTVANNFGKGIGAWEGRQ